MRGKIATILKFLIVSAVITITVVLAYSLIKPGSPMRQDEPASSNNISTAPPPQEKVAQPEDKNAFEETREYGKLDCASFESNPIAGEMFKLVNADRVKNKKPALKWNNKLCESATLKSEDLVKYSYFEHVSPNLVTPWHWMDVAGYKYIFSGENLALNYFTADTAHVALMESPGHRANILNDNFTEIGISYDWGKIDGKDAFFIVEHFGQPAPINPPVKVVCTDIKKAKKNIRSFNNQLDDIDKYLEEAEDILRQYEEAGQDTKKVLDYIDDLEDKKKQIKKYIKENEKYLEECQTKNSP